MYILKPTFDLIYINLYNLYLLIHLLCVLYSASIRHAGISAIEKQYYYIIIALLGSTVSLSITLLRQIVPKISLQNPPIDRSLVLVSFFILLSVYLM